MEKSQLSQTAQQMFLQGAGRKAVTEFFTANGISDEEAETMTTEAYRAVKPQRQAILKEQHAEPEAVGGGGMGSIVVGGLMILGGIIATMNTDRIWYGLMIVGAIALFKGIADQIK